LPPPHLQQTWSHPPQGEVPKTATIYKNQTFLTTSKPTEVRASFNPISTLQPKLNSALQSLANDLITKEKAKIENQIRELQESTLKMQGEIEKYQMIAQL
jgi:hypothetical protein